MKEIKAKLIKIGNSVGITIPAAIINQKGRSAMTSIEELYSNIEEECNEGEAEYKKLLKEKEIYGRLHW